MPTSDNSGTARPRATGPCAAAGKARSSLNTFKHGRASVKHSALPPNIEDDEAFPRILRGQLSHFAPASNVESGIVRQLAHSEWASFRLHAVEAACLDRIYQNQGSLVMGQASVESPPARLGSALENSVNSSGMAHDLASRLSRLITGRNRLNLTLRSTRRFSSAGRREVSSGNPLSETTQVIDSNNSPDDRLPKTNSARTSV